MLEQLCFFVFNKCFLRAVVRLFKCSSAQSLVFLLFVLCIVSWISCIQYTIRLTKSYLLTLCKDHLQLFRMVYHVPDVGYYLLNFWYVITVSGDKG